MDNNQIKTNNKTVTSEKLDQIEIDNKTVTSEELEELGIKDVVKFKEAIEYVLNYEKNISQQKNLIDNFKVNEYNVKANLLVKIYKNKELYELKKKGVSFLKLACELDDILGIHQLATDEKQVKNANHKLIKKNLRKSLIKAQSEFKLKQIKEQIDEDIFKYIDEKEIEKCKNLKPEKIEKKIQKIIIKNMKTKFKKEIKNYKNNIKFLSKLQKKYKNKFFFFKEQPIISDIQKEKENLTKYTKELNNLKHIKLHNFETTIDTQTALDKLIEINNSLKEYNQKYNAPNIM